MPDALAPILQLLILVGVPSGVFLAVHILRNRQRHRVIDLVRRAIEADRPLPPEVVEALSARSAPSAHSDLRRGVLLIAVGVALGVVGLFSFVIIDATGGSGGIPVGASIAGLGAIPACLGAALVFLSRIGKP